MVKTVIERAFELAITGQCRTMSDIHRQLAREHYVDAHGHLSGAGTMRQLRQLMRRHGQVNNCDDAMKVDPATIDPASPSPSSCVEGMGSG